MSFGRFSTLVIGVAAGLASPFFLPSAEAHSPGGYYGIQWPTNSDEYYFIENGVPDTPGFRNQIRLGIATWSHAGGGDSPRFFDGGVATATPTTNPCNGSRSKVFTVEDVSSFYGDAPESVNGYTQTCKVGSSAGALITQFQILLELTPTRANSVGWNHNNGAPGPRQWDLQSVASHEAGHATGWGNHFAPNGAYCDDPPTASTHTMCGASDTFIGEYERRTRETHDTHTIGAAY